MVAEQTTRSRFWPTPALPPREVDLRARIETPGDGEADVDTRLLYEPLPAAWDEAVARGLYDGVHAGLAAVGGPLPMGGIRVSITRLRIRPTLSPDPEPADIEAVARTVGAIAASTVEALWAGLRAPASPEDRGMGG